MKCFNCYSDFIQHLTNPDVHVVGIATTAENSVVFIQKKAEKTDNFQIVGINNMRPFSINGMSLPKIVEIVGSSEKKLGKMLLRLH